MEHENNSFEYTYSAPQQAEIKKIREKYLPKEADKMEQLRQLDKSAAKRGTAVALGLGTTSALILGVGMCCTMVWAEQFFVPGIIIGLAGILGVALTYPLYVRIIKREREKIAPEILRLTDELLK